MSTYSEQYLTEIALKGAYGEWGTRYRQFLLQHDKEKYYSLLCSRILHEHITQIDVRAERLYEQTVKRFAEQEGVTEELKKKDPALWQAEMKRVKERSRELVLKEVVCA